MGPDGAAVVTPATFAGVPGGVVRHGPPVVPPCADGLPLRAHRRRRIGGEIYRKRPTTCELRGQTCWRADLR
jgi:hypothetical protein